MSFPAPVLIADSNTRVFVTGGAGFIGSHLTDHLAALGCRVTVLDNLVNGRRENLADAIAHRYRQPAKLQSRGSGKESAGLFPSGPPPARAG